MSVAAEAPTVDSAAAASTQPSTSYSCVTLRPRRHAQHRSQTAGCCCFDEQFSRGGQIAAVLPLMWQHDIAAMMWPAAEGAPRRDAVHSRKWRRTAHRQAEKTYEAPAAAQAELLARYDALSKNRLEPAMPLCW